MTPTMSPLWTAHDLAEATGGSMVAPFDATGVSIDTRTLAPGDLFIALHGENGDGHRFVGDALAKGAAGAMVHQDVPGATNLLHVDDTLAALGRLGGYARARFAGRVVAVTGSVGKTTTKEMLRCVLSALGPVHAAVASYNNHWGLPLTLARLPSDAAFCVVEIGMNHVGEIAPLARLARPHVAVITAIEKAHIGFLGSIEAIADEKASVMAGLEPGAAAVLPTDTPLFPRLRAAADAAGARVIGFGADAAADMRLVDITTDAEGSEVAATLDGVPTRFRINAPGRHMAMNALAALAAANAAATPPPLVGGGWGEGAVGASPRRTPPPNLGPLRGPSPQGEGESSHSSRIIRALETFAPLTGRGARRRIALPGGTALLLDESYNGNPASIRAALSVLALQPARRRIAVLGDMLELGEAGPSEHTALTPDVAAAADLVFACGPLMRHLFNALPDHKRAAHAADSTALAPLVAHAVAAGDAVLVKGSLGSRMRHVVDALDAVSAKYDAEEAA
jgi:UDP-N-acetylmuramoyl-tripeptide--D-alanyl-D-alanine ligase